MPIYEYRCSACDQVFEALQRVSDAALDTCRRCGGPARRIISAPAIQFVGSGWYVTDYARKKKKGDASGRNGRDDASAPKKTGSAESGKKKSAKAKKDRAAAAASGRGRPARADG